MCSSDLIGQGAVERNGARLWVPGGGKLAIAQLYVVDVQVG